MFNQVKEEFPAAKNAKLFMNFIEIKAKCDICNETFTMDYLNLICPNDNSHTLNIVQGNELFIESMDIEK
jgi:Zn finger protein HypA/HybF involved in hydrogenase expression